MRLPVGTARTGGAYTRLLDSAIALPLWSQVVLVAVIAASTAARCSASWPVCSCTTPVAIVITGKVYENAALVLPEVSPHR